MNYFGYQHSVSGQIWSLFRELGEITPEQREKVYAGSEYAHTLEIVSAALNGHISTDPVSLENFNLWGYESKCADMDAHGKRARAKKVLNIVEFSTSSDDSIDVGYGEVSARELGYEDSMFDTIVESVDFEENLRRLFNIRTKYICEKGVDIVSVLYGALKGIPDAMTEIKTLVADSTLRELYTQLCEGNQNGTLIRRLELAV